MTEYPEAGLREVKPKRRPVRGRNLTDEEIKAQHAGRKPGPPKPSELDEREIIFIEAYCTNGHNPQRAAWDAGYKNVNQCYEILNRPRIAKAIYERMRFERMAAPEIVSKVGQLARADLRHYLKVESEPVEEERIDETTGEITKVVVWRKRVVVDLVHAMQRNETFPLKSIEFYRTGEVKKITIEDKLEALKLIGTVFGLFGTGQRPGDDGRAWFDKARDLGYEPRMVLDEVVRIAAEWKMELPKELIDGQFSQHINEKGSVEIEFSNPDGDKETNP